MEIKEIKQWFELAVPTPTEANKKMQLGCHYEEVAEMMQSTFDIEHKVVSDLADFYKGWGDSPHQKCDVAHDFLLDALCDQIVTAIGVAHMFGYDIEGALKEVNRSNFSKFVDGKPVFNEQGKISKPSSYSPPNLLPYLGDQK